MGRRHHSRPEGPDAGGMAEPRCELRLVFQALPLAVRHVLTTIMEDLGPLRLNPDARSAVELVLAEALNNVVEHAYRNPQGEWADGFIDLRIAQDGETLRVVLCDRGRPMPDHALPVSATAHRTPQAKRLTGAGAAIASDAANAQAPPPSAPPRPEHLPEGGFGWFLIRALTEDVTYARVNGENRLAMVLRTTAAARSRCGQ